MSNNKQSSVDWLARKLKDFPHIKHSQEFKDLVKQAKGMHKEEIIYSVEVGYTNGYLNKEYDGHQHYNETFNQETK